jgi:hypothetical protein
MTAITNQLSTATSLYLLQHKDNPVAWQQWSADVLELAEQQDKPILLSIGYSACHWCHVMASESFDDPETAALMNKMFINIKVDREQRPDLDQVYQLAHQFLTGRAGGWPLTVFLCPRTYLPFLVGTYFPKQGLNNRISFKELLTKVNDYYHSRGKDFIDTLDEVRNRYQELTEAEQTLDKEADLSRIPVDKAAIDILKEADLQFGGFGNAPKFAMPMLLERLLVAYLDKHPMAAQAQRHLRTSLLSMARSGIVDQVGGGFFRYATDTQWMIPHFEKMLYDNALMLAICAQAWSINGEEEIERCARTTARWVLDELAAPDGGFYASINADQNGKEGAYYCWQVADIDALLDDRERAVIHTVFDLDKFPNFQQGYHLHRHRSWVAICDELELDSSEVQGLYHAAIEKLRARRQQNPINRDEKILTGWNGLMIRGLAVAARVFADEEYLLAAQKAADFIRQKLWLNNRLYASWQNGQANNSAYLDDYVFLVDGLMELLRIQWRDQDYRFIGNLLESMIDNFEDKEHGGFYFSAHDSEQLIYRGKPLQDTVIPAGNGVAAKVLGRYGHLTTEPHYLKCAQLTLLNAWASMLRQPKSHHTCLLALAEHLQAPVHVLLKGDSQMDEWRHQVQLQYGERVQCYWVPEDSEIHPPELFLLEGNQGLVCVGDHCLEPQDHLAELLVQLDSALNDKRQ